MMTITFPDGEILDDLEMNGNNFVTSKALDEKFFENNLDGVVIDGVTHDRMVLDAVQTIDGKCYFIIRDMTENEIFQADVMGKIEYLSMMTDVEIVR